MTHTRFSVRAAGLVGVVVGSLGVGAAAHATAGSSATVTPVRDIAAYPAPLPDGCPGGTASLVGLTFDNGRGEVAGSLADLDVSGGDAVTMSWDRLSAGCQDDAGQPQVMLTLAAYATTQREFDPTQDQELLAGAASCGVGAGPCETVGSRHQLPS